MIIDVPGVGKVEFPDSMGADAMNKAARKLYMDAKIQKQQEADKELYKPTSDSFWGNLMPAAGAGMAQTVRAIDSAGLMERGGLPGVMVGGPVRIAQMLAEKYGLPASKEEAARLDAPLDAAPGGTTGRVLGASALLAPMAAIPGMNTLIGSLIGGGATGLLTTEGDAKERAIGGLLGTAGGGAGYGLGKLLQAGAGMVKGLIRPFTKSGQEKIAGEALERFATDPAAVMSAQGGKSVTGATPTLAEATKDPGLAVLQRAVSTMDPDAAAQFLARDQANNAARVGALTDLAGTTGARTVAAEARDAAAQNLYGKAFATDASKNMTPAIQSEINSLLKRPSIQAARSKAAELAADKGIDALEEGSVQGLHYMKLALDDAINSAGQKGIGGTERGALIANRDKLVAVIEKLAPDYAAAKATYAAMSKPLNQMDVGQRLLDSTRGASADLANNRPFQAASFARALNNEESLLKTATGRSGSLANVMEPEQMGLLNAVRNELDTVAGLDKAAGGKGSQTAKMLASQHLLKNIAGPLGIPDSWAGSAASETIMRGPQWVLKAAEPRIHAAVAQGLLNPAEAQRLIMLARQANTPSEAAALLRQLAPGLLGYGAAQSGAN